MTSPYGPYIPNKKLNFGLVSDPIMDYSSSRDIYAVAASERQMSDINLTRGGSQGPKCDQQHKDHRYTNCSEEGTNRGFLQDPVQQFNYRYDIDYFAEVNTSVRVPQEDQLTLGFLQNKIETMGYLQRLLVTILGQRLRSSPQETSQILKPHRTNPLQMSASELASHISSPTNSSDGPYTEHKSPENYAGLQFRQVDVGYVRPFPTDHLKRRNVASVKIPLRESQEVEYYKELQSDYVDIHWTSQIQHGKDTDTGRSREMDSNILDFGLRNSDVMSVRNIFILLIRRQLNKIDTLSIAKLSNYIEDMNGPTRKMSERMGPLTSRQFENLLGILSNAIGKHDQLFGRTTHNQSAETISDTPISDFMRF